MSLPDKQARFVEEYLIDLNATAAAERAGYSDGNYGRQLLTNPNVSEAVAAALVERTERTKVTADWVVSKLVENVERSMQAEAVRDREGNETGEYTYQGSVANKALELLGKHVGLFGDKLEVTGKDGGALEVVVRRTVVNADR